MVNASLPYRPPSTTRSGSGPRAASGVEMPNEPKRRRNQREAARMTCQPHGQQKSVLAPLRADPDPRKPMLPNTEGTQEPREFWRIRREGGASEPGAGCCRRGLSGH
jgi:hypothetical protein